MNYRPATEADYPRLVEMHREQGLGYTLPPLGDPSLVVKLVAENESKVAYAALLRLSAEAYLLTSKDDTPAERWDTIKAGNEHLIRMAWDAGFNDINCWLPPQVARPFGKRMVQLGWERNIWPCFSIWPGTVLRKGI